jgi:hypothetical protein
MQIDIHTALAHMVAPTLRKGGVEHVVSRLHIFILLINLSFALSLILIS